MGHARPRARTSPLQLHRANPCNLPLVLVLAQEEPPHALAALRLALAEAPRVVVLRARPALEGQVVRGRAPAHLALVGLALPARLAGALALGPVALAEGPPAQ